MKTIILITPALISSAVFILESRAAEQGTSPVNTSLKVGIQGKGSSTVQDLTIIAGLLKKETGISLHTLLEDNISRRLEWLKNGKIDLFYEGSYIPVLLQGGAPGTMDIKRGPFQIRIVASAHSGAFGFMVRADSPIKTIHDIKPDTRIALPPSGREMIYGLLAWAELNRGPLSAPPSQIQWNATLVPVDGWEENLRSIAEGRADVAWATPENPIVKAAAKSLPGIRFLSLPVKEDPEGAQRFRRFMPFGKLMPAPRFGVKEIRGVTSMVGTACLWSRADMDSDLVYDLTRWFDVSYNLYRDKGNKLATYTREAFRWTLDVAMAPVHDGTVKYFKEIGLWTIDDDARQEYNNKLMTWYCEAWDAAIAMAEKKNIDISDKNKDWTRLWADHKKDIGIPPIRQMTGEEIQKGLMLLKTLGQ